MQRISITNPQNIIDGTAKKYYFKLRNTGGPKGDKGDKGDTGSQGPRGPQGDPCTVVVNSTATLEPGSNAYVTNTGSLSNAVLNFGIPQGPRGPQGVKGDPGEPGQKGEPGPRGIQGERGTNATVYVGTTSTLNPGSQATVYNSGSDSNAVLNFGIPKGEKGDTGNQGPTGPAGQNFAPTIVAELPATGDESKLYLTPKAHTAQTATGNPITASVTEQAGALESFQLDGDTYQQSYTGKNLLGASLATMQSENTDGTWSNGAYTYHGITVTPVFSNGLLQRIELSGTATSNFTFKVAKSYSKSEFEAIVTAGETYTLSGCPSGGSSRTYYLRVLENPYKNLYTDTGEGITKQMPSISSGAIVVWLVIGIDSGTDTTGLVFRPQFEKSATATSYEPFVGGQASPNPEYPQAIQTVTGEQTVTVVGKNRLRQIDGTYSKNGITATVNNGKITLNGTATAIAYIPLSASSDYYSLDLSGEYTLSANRITGVSYTIYYGASSVLYSTSSSQTKTLSGTYEDIRFQINVAQGTTLNNVVVEAQLEAGSTATAYEPYSSNDYEINLGKNLWSATTLVTGYYKFADGGLVTGGNPNYVTSIEKIDVTAGESYHLSADKGAGVAGSGCVFFNNDTFVSSLVNPSESNFTVPKGANKMVFNFFSNAGLSPSEVTHIQLEKGSTATAYAPYFTPIELCKLGDYQDYIYKDGDDWKVHKATGKKTFSDGSSFFQSGRTTSSFLAIAVNLSELDSVSLANNSFAKATHFRFTGAQGENGGMDIYNGSTYAQNFVCYLDKTAMPNLSTAQNWITVHKPQIVYVRYFATDTTITDTTLIAQLEAIRTAALQNGTNTITNTATGTNLAGDMEIGYYGYNPTNRYDKFIWLDINNNYEQIGS